MQIRVMEDSVEINGYVNAIERKSKPMRSRVGQFVERICKGAFKRAIERNDNIRLLLNHNRNRDLGGTRDGNLELAEDNIGLRARAIIKDPEIVKKARNGDLVGWSFGFEDMPNGVTETVEDGIRTRNVNDMNLHEVSILDRSRTPAYEGTLVTVRDDNGTETVVYESEPMFYDPEIRESEPEKEPEQKKEEEIVIDYSKYDEMIKEMKGA